MANLQVAQTILEQLGGRKFLVMTGAKNLIGSENSLSFRLPGTPGFVKDGINYVRVILHANDTYQVEFLKVRGVSSWTKASFVEVYCDQLQEIFTRQTGLVTSLGTLGRQGQ